MLKTFAVALFAMVMSVGLAQAKAHKHAVPACSEGKQATAPCACGEARCQKGEWCHSWLVSYLYYARPSQHACAP
jgi:hypothetical protein